MGYRNAKAEKSSPPSMIPWRVMPPPPSLNSAAAAASPSNSLYMWAAPSMIHPHAAAFYAHYARPGVPPTGASPGVEPSERTEGAFVKKLAGVDGRSMSVRNESLDTSDHGSSEREANDGSTDGNNGTLAGASKAGRKRSRQRSPKTGFAPKQAADVQASDKAAAEAKAYSEMNAAPPIPLDAWLQNEREMKRERRKQSNRESARRSRLRKQSEAEELAKKVQALTSDNLNLKAEMSKLRESSAMLKLQNVALMEKIKDPHLGVTDDNQRVKPVATMNLLARVNNSSLNEDRDMEDEKTATAGAVYEGRSDKLHHLLDAKSLRNDAVAAG